MRARASRRLLNEQTRRARTLVFVRRFAGARPSRAIAAARAVRPHRETRRGSNPRRSAGSSSVAPSCRQPWCLSGARRRGERDCNGAGDNASGAKFGFEQLADGARARWTPRSSVSKQSRRDFTIGGRPSSVFREKSFSRARSTSHSSHREAPVAGSRDVLRGCAR
jgi:hypothetical protein